MFAATVHVVVTTWTQLLVSQVFRGKLRLRGCVLRILHLVCQKLNLVVGAFQLELEALNRFLLVLDNFQTRILVNDW